MIKAVLFDAYRTVINDEGMHEAATRHVLDKHRLDFNVSEFHAIWDKFMLEGWTDDKFATQRVMFKHALLSAFNHFRVEGITDEDASYGVEHWLDMLAVAPPYPEAREALDEVSRNCSTAIVSNIDDREVYMCLERAELTFSVVVTSEAAASYKPNPEIFMMALGKLGVGANEAIMVGDSQFADVQGAKNIGMLSVWINRDSRKPNPALPAPDFNLPDLSGLPKILHNLA